MKSNICSFTFLVILLFSGANTFSQRKIALSATVAPFYGHSKSSVVATVPDPNGSGGFISQELKSEASPKGYWVGLNGRYSFSEKWSASTGFWFGYYTIKVSDARSRSHQFSIPVIAHFQPSERKLSPYFSAGALWNFSTTSRLEIPDFGTAVFKSGRNMSRISPTVGAGVIYHFAERLALVAQPTFTYAIPPSGIDIRAYQLGLNVQVMYKF
jgi:hypothetical protein